MYIIYWQPYPDSFKEHYLITVRDRRIRTIGLFPSESQWIVPGTVDPNE